LGVVAGVGVELGVGVGTGAGGWVGDGAGLGCAGGSGTLATCTLSKMTRWPTCRSSARSRSSISEPAATAVVLTVTCFQVPVPLNQVTE
jgi:hypothetical protein